MLYPNFTEISEENKYTEKYVFKTGLFSVDVLGDFVGTVTLQKSYDGGRTWEDVDKFVKPISTCGTNSESYTYYRMGGHTGDYLSGTLYARIGQ